MARQPPPSPAQNSLWPPGAPGPLPTRTIWWASPKGPVSAGLTLMGGPSQPACVVVSILSPTLPLAGGGGPPPPPHMDRRSTRVAPGWVTHSPPPHPPPPAPPP